MQERKLKLTLETVTPLFLGGADPQGKPELRAASFRGELRFWLRALLGGVVGSDDTQRLHQLESNLMGSTGSASPVTISLTGQDLRSENFRPLPHSTSKTFTFPGFAPNERFILTLSPRPGLTTIPEGVLAALLLLLNLGGLGKRSRRGFGSLQVQDVQASGLDLPREAVDLLEAKPADGRNLVRHVQSLVTWGQKVVQGQPDRVRSNPAYPVLSSACATILVGKRPADPQSYETAMQGFWELLRGKYQRNERAFGYVGGQQRRASPLIIHITRTPQGYHLVMTAFYSSGAWEVIRNFLEDARKKWDGEYILGGRQDD